jgi:hypothetical protein
MDDVALMPLRVSDKYIVIEGGYKKYPALVPILNIGGHRFIEIRLKTSEWCQMLTGKPRGSVKMQEVLKIFCEIYKAATCAAKSARKKTSITRRALPILEINMPMAFKNRKIGDEIISFPIANRPRLITIPCEDVVLKWFWAWAVDEIADGICDPKDGGIECAQCVA